MKRSIFLSLLLLMMTLAIPAFAAAPEPWGIAMQDAASPSAERIHAFHNMLLYIITAIAVFVLLLLLFVVARYNKRANPNPSQFTHNVLVEVIWTVIPIVILIVIVVPSFQLLYYTDRAEKTEMTLKVTGYQWYWGYEYPEQNSINFLSYMIPEKDIDTNMGQKRLLSVDNPVVLPVETNIKILVTGNDVIHSWAVPALGIKIDAIPGRLNETWVRIDKPGVYYGQCSEICGKDHSFMPIEIHAVSKEEFQAWVEKAKKDFANDNTAPVEHKFAALEGR